MASKTRKTTTQTTPEQEITLTPEQTATAAAEQIPEPTPTPINPAMAKILAKAQEMAAKHPSPKRTKAPRQCACGCGGWTKGGTWIPGHDAKALSAALAQIRSAQTATPTAA